MWAASTPFAIGPYLVGVRSNTGDLDARLRALLPGRAVDADDVPHHYSVAVEARGDGPIRRLHALYRGGRPVVRSRSAGRVVEALLDHLDAHLTDARDDLLLLNAVALVRGEGAAVVVGARHADVALLDRRLGRAGWQIVDRPGAALDATGALIVPERRLNADPRALDDLAAQRDGGVEPGRYPVDAWIEVGAGRTPSAAAAVARAFDHAHNVDRLGGQAALTALASAAGGSQRQAVQRLNPELPDALAARRLLDSVHLA